MGALEDLLASNPNFSAPTTQPAPAPAPSATPRTLGEIWSRALAARGIAPPAAPAPPPAPTTPAEIIEANPNFSAPTRAVPTRGPLATGYVPIGPAQTKEEADDEAYRARQAESYKPKEKREAPAAAGPSVPAGVGNKYASGNGSERSEAAPRDINWGGAGGTSVIPAHEQPVVAAPRQKQLTGAIDKQKDAVAESADAASEIEKAKGQGAQDVAKAYEDAGVDVKLRQQENAEQLKAFRSKIDDFSAKIAKDKINSNRMWEDASTGQRIAWTTARALGAVGQAFLHQPTNQVADYIDSQVAKDVADQRANHEIGRERLADMNTFYGHALRETASAEEAERVAQGYALEAAKQQAQALALNANSPAQKAKGKELVAALDEKLAEKGIAMNPYVQARTVATGPDMNKVYATARAYVDDQAKLGNVVKPDEAIRYAYKMHTGHDPLTGAGAFNQGAKSEGAKKELDDARTEVQGGIGTIDRALDSGAAYKQGPVGALWAHVPGATQSKKDALERDAYNAQVKQLVGAAWRLQTGGMEPKNPGIIEELSDHYQIKPSDSDELARERMKRLQQTLRDSGTAKGVLADEANRDLQGIPSQFRGVVKGAPPSFTPVAPAKK